MYIREEVSHSITVERSRFIAYIKPVFDEDEYKAYLKEIRKKHYNATHVCSAFVCGNIELPSTAALSTAPSVPGAAAGNSSAMTLFVFAAIKSPAPIAADTAVIPAFFFKLFAFMLTSCLLSSVKVSASEQNTLILCGVLTIPKAFPCFSCILLLPAKLHRKRLPFFNGSLEV